MWTANPKFSTFAELTIRFSLIIADATDHISQCLVRPDVNQPAILCITRSASCFFLPRTVHSHTIRTRHPAEFSLAIFLPSFLALRVIFLFQKSAFVLGHVNSWHSCLCHRQPWTNTTALCFGKTRSGHPGKERV
jgi:hypothetical protein